MNSERLDPVWYKVTINDGTNRYENLKREYILKQKRQENGEGGELKTSGDTLRAYDRASVSPGLAKLIAAYNAIK